VSEPARSSPAGRPSGATVGGRVPTDPSVSVCILVLDHTRLVARCLEALRRGGGCPPATELIVVANGTPREQLAALGDADDLVVLASQVNLGFAGGCNLAASVARGRSLVFLNDDSTVEPGCIDALVAAASAPGVGAVGSRILDPDGTLQEAGSVVWRDGSGAHVGIGLPPGDPSYAAARDVDYASANGLLVTREAWEAVGGFDPAYYPAYFEDVDLCLALQAHGYRVRYEPGARIVHQGSQSTSEPFRGFLLARNRQRLVARWGGSLDRFDPRPAAGSGPAFDAAVARAVARAAVAGGRPRPVPTGPSDPAGAPIRGGTFDAGAADRELRRDYLAYLERTVTESAERVRVLEAYVARRWSVRLRRWGWKRSGFLRRS